MGHERARARYASWYSMLVRLYPASFRERFGGEMEQLFRDRLRDHAEDGRSLAGHALWMFAETFSGLIRERASSFRHRHKNVLRLALATLAILLVPAVAMQMTDEVVWTISDFVFAGSALFGTGLAYELVARRSSGVYRAAMSLALGSALLLVWINGSVGLIGSEDNDINALYYGVLAVGLLGAAVARLKPPGMADPTRSGFENLERTKVFVRRRGGLSGYRRNLTLHRSGRDHLDEPRGFDVSDIACGKSPASHTRRDRCS